MQEKTSGLLEVVSTKNDSAAEDLNSSPLTMSFCIQWTIHCFSEIIDKYFQITLKLEKPFVIYCSIVKNKNKKLSANSILSGKYIARTIKSLSNQANIKAILKGKSLKLNFPHFIPNSWTNLR